MKNLSFLLLITLFFLASCGSPSTEAAADAIIETTDTLLAATTEVTDTSIFTIKAKFIDFSLGDASHYGFEDESGKYWDFGDCLSETCDFAQELEESEMDESNQGWGSNKALQGKWFVLTCKKVEQPIYLEGPMGMVDVIQEAVLVDK